MAANVNTKYESDSGDIHPIRLRPDTNAVVGTAPAGAVNNNIRVKVSKGSRQFGIKPRGVVISRTRGTAPDTFQVTQFIPVLSASAFGNSPFSLGSTISYKGVSWTVVSLKSEDIN